MFQSSYQITYLFKYNIVKFFSVRGTFLDLFLAQNQNISIPFTLISNIISPDKCQIPHKLVCQGIGKVKSGFDRNGLYSRPSSLSSKFEIYLFQSVLKETYI